MEIERKCEMRSSKIMTIFNMHMSVNQPSDKLIEVTSLRY